MNLQCFTVLFFCRYKPIAFLPFSLTRSPSSLLKLPFNDYDLPNISSSEAVDQEASATML